MAQSNTSPLTIQNLEKKYGDRTILQIPVFAIQEPQRVALLGPNGAGKTSLFRSIGGSLRPTQGTIEIFGVDRRSRQARDRMGLVPQDIALYQDLTVLQNLQAFGRLHGLTSAGLQERSTWALQWCALEDRCHHLVRALSGGMQRRLNIACSCLHRPDLLILDEPTVGVDPQSRLRIFEMLDQLFHAGTTIVLTTHQLEEAQAFCDRIVMIDHGKIIADGSFEQLVEQSIGTRRRVYLSTQGEMTSAIPELVWSPSQDRWIGTIENVATELPQLISRVAERGSHVLDVEVRSPRLEDVFLYLTGRELRE